MSASAGYMPPQPLSPEAQREAFALRRFLAMPLAGAICWSVVVLGGAILPLSLAVWVLYLATGIIAWLGIGL